MKNSILILQFTALELKPNHNNPAHKKPLKTVIQLSHLIHNMCTMNDQICYFIYLYLITQ